MSIKERLDIVAKNIGWVNGSLHVMITRRKFNPTEARDMVRYLEAALLKLKDLCDGKRNSDT
jgi:hypothetical protein